MHYTNSSINFSYIITKIQETPSGRNDSEIHLLGSSKSTTGLDASKKVFYSKSETLENCTQLLKINQHIKQVV